MSNGLFFMLPEVPDLNLPYIPPKPEVFNLPEVPNLHDMSDEERGEFHRQIREMELRIEQLNQQNEDLRGKLREGQLKLFRQDIARAQARPEWQTWELHGNALQSSVLRLREEMFLVDAGPGTPRICMQDEPTGVPINRATRFENKVGSLDLVAGESLIKEQILGEILHRSSGR
ncbi:hypothetical protein Acr_00g0002990 [Actinidia rufa]|uniref:Uncharacterized protein n=1 Tax=Actinidia rufa TaxID=165716 RepID=A0A7J0D710_9ERIC|nr:hypothetical protein Acr_00g0002990 [Actinidia rufa]